MHLLHLVSWIFVWVQLQGQLVVCFLYFSLHDCAASLVSCGLVQRLS